MEPHYADDLATLYHGDCREVLAELPDCSVDAVVTDPPYGLEFMGKDWDAPWKGDTRQIGDSSFQKGRSKHGQVRHGLGASYGGNAQEKLRHYQSWMTDVAAECLRVLKPGGHLLAFGGTRTWHRMAVAIEDAGFEIRDSIAWMYGSGFPKSHNVAIAIDKAAGAMGHRGVRVSVAGNRAQGQDLPHASSMPAHEPATDAAANWQGWGTALKPAFEPVVVARKPLIGTVAENVLEHGTGALNIDGCRIDYASDADKGKALAGDAFKRKDTSDKGWSRPWMEDPERIAEMNREAKQRAQAGRWPANVILDEDQAAALDQQSGVQKDGVAVNRNRSADTEKRGWIGPTASRVGQPDVTYGGTGGASRFFYVPKANRKERPTADGVAHPTVKPLALMTYLIRLVTPPGGIVLDPFAGSGTTLEAATVEGFRSIGIELTPEYLPLIEQRLRRNIQPTLDTAS
jgi:DNA modification methylase